MDNLQELYDYYIQTEPSEGKIKSATNLLIYICQALNINSPEEVTTDLFIEIPSAIDKFYKSSKHKAIQHKSILAEMIGRYGPRDGWEKTIDILLKDKDENLRQFTLLSMQFYSLIDPLKTISYIERYKSSDDKLMRNVSANFMCKTLCSEKSEIIKPVLIRWAQEGDLPFIEEIAKSMENHFNRSAKIEVDNKCQLIYDWIIQEFNLDKS